MTAINQAAATETTATEAPRLTRMEKLLARAQVLAKRIEADTTAYNAIKAEIDGAEALKNVAEGSVISVKFGRRFSAEKDTTRVVTATVIGVREDEDGAKQYKVTYGSGFDAEVAVVGSSSIVGVGPVVEQPPLDFVTGEPITG